MKPISITDISVFAEKWPIDGTFSISRGSRTYAEVVMVELKSEIATGRGECVPYARYGESVESVIAQIEAERSNLQNGLDREVLKSKMPAGAARNAIDCALWDLEAKHSDISIFETLEDELALNTNASIETAFTISLGSVDKMHQSAKENSDRKLLKIKLGGDDDAEKMKAVRDGAPNSRLILDANEGWNKDSIVDHIKTAKEIGADLIEQPLPADDDEILSTIDRLVDVCADESLHTFKDILSLKDRYDCINIKLDKSGGLTEAISMFHEAKKHDFKIMVGCMVSTSLAMAPAMFLAQGADFVDLDGPLLLAKDRENGLKYSGSIVAMPKPGLWG